MPTLLQVTAGSVRRSIGQESSEAVSSLIEAAKRVQVKRLRRIVTEIQNSVDHSAANGRTSPPLGLGRGSALVTTQTTPDDSTQSVGVNGRDDKGRTALHFSSGMASPECATILLEAGADPNAGDHDGFTPLHMAAGYGRGQCIDLLLKYGANPFIKDKAGRTARELAVEINNGTMRGHDGSLVPRGDMDETVTLLANAEWKEHLASREKQRASHGDQQPAASAEALPRAPYEELINMAASGDLAGVSAILEKFPDTADALWQTSRAATLGNALSAACRGGHMEAAKVLLKSGASIDAHDSDGATPLLAAADSGYADCVKLLLDAGAQPDEKDRVGVTALIAAGYNGHADSLEVLLSSGAQVDARSHGGVTPLIAAAEGRHANCILVLLKAGADVDARTSEGKTALMHAVGRNAVEATKALLDGGANGNAADMDGCTPLHHGARSDAADCLVVLCDRGADVTRRCRKGRTAQMEAPPKSGASSVLEARWIALEAEVARRQAELLSLFGQEAAGHPSAAAAKGASPRSKDKRKERRKKEGSKETRSRKTIAPTEGPEASLARESTGTESALPVATSSSADPLPGEPDLAFDSEDIFEIMAASSGKSQGSQEAGTEEREGSKVGTAEAAPVARAAPVHPESDPPQRKLSEDEDDWIRVDSKGVRSHGASVKAAGTARKRVAAGDELGKREEPASAKEDDNGTPPWPVRKKGTGNKQPKKKDEGGKPPGAVETGAIESSPWVRAVLQTGAPHAETSRDHGTEKTETESAQRADECTPLVLSDSQKKTEAEDRLEQEAHAESCQLPGALKSGELELEALRSQLTHAEELLQRERKLLEAERERVAELDLAFQEERARAEQAHLELLELKEAMAAQEVARLETERERAQLERKLQELQRMNTKRAFLEERGTSKRGPGSAIGRAHTAAGIIIDSAA